MVTRSNETLAVPRPHPDGLPQDGGLAPWLLGCAGLIPFAVLAGEILAARKILFGVGPALYALQIYGAVVLSFLGGVHWGLAVAASVFGATSNAARRYGMSVLPAVAAWGGLWLTGSSGLWLLVAGFIGLLIYDLATVATGEVPPWYGRLRLLLTAIVVLLLAATALFGPF